ncbi:hypothetical protein [Croceitalea sp. MTPC5]|uniref:hypothetical protein n=1 Tax=Croceitalea sp. MTPC5 TaxID=3056565 RepID=UPI0030CFA575
MNEIDKIKELHRSLICSELYTFPKKGKVNVSSKHGVYVIYSQTDQVLHVGMTPSGKKGLNQRLYNHISKTGVFYREYLKPNDICLRGRGKYRYIEIDNPRLRALVEALTAGLLCPIHFGTGIKRVKKEE